MRTQSALFGVSPSINPPQHDPTADDAEPAESSCRDLLDALRAVVDPRHRRGIRRLPTDGMITADGKTLRGAHAGDGRAVHLLAAMLNQDRAVLAQREIPYKTNEITAFAPLLEELDLTGMLISADALHTQRAHARYLVEDKHADYLLTVKDSQPTLFAQLNALPWSKVPQTHRATLRVRTSHRISQLRAVLTQPNQLYPFVLAQRASTALTTPPLSVDPVPQRPIRDSQLPGDLRDRLAGLPNQPHRALLKILIELPACLRHRPSLIGDVSTLRGETHAGFHPVRWRRRRDGWRRGPPPA